MSGALELAFGIPLWIGYIVSAVMVIPLVTPWREADQPVPARHAALLDRPEHSSFVFIAFADWEKVGLWLAYAGIHHTSGPPARSRVPSRRIRRCLGGHLRSDGADRRAGGLPPLPAADGERKLRHRIAVFLAGSGWVIVGAPKLLAGSFLVVLALSTGVPSTRAADPAQMYYTAFGYIFPIGTAALLLMAAFVVVSQLRST